MRTYPLLAVLLLIACKDEVTTDDSIGVVDDSGPIETVDEDADGYPAEEDCDDSNAAVNPGAAEVCDGLDNNCDGTPDGEDASDASTWYADGDGDGYGLDAASVRACEMPSGYAAEAGDCDDTQASYHPGATEDDCSDPNDYNCDGSVGFADNDGDGFPACEDCDDSSAEASPEGVEVCDDVDNNCDGSVDEGVTLESWQDADQDGYGDADYPTTACDVPAGYTDNSADCDDSVAEVNPAATEVCNGLDDNCDGTIDLDAANVPSWYADTDADGYGDPDTDISQCDAPSGYVSDSSDCDDANGGVNPGATEVCNGLDDDCDGSVDSGASDMSTWYADSDGDGYGDTSSSTLSCDTPSGYVADSSDCDDSSAAVNPAASETCDSVDNDCDGSIDPSTSSDAKTYYPDADKDGYGATSGSVNSCSKPSGYVGNKKDCDDSVSTTYTGATEICDAVDNDCDGTIDDGVLGTGSACPASDCSDILADNASAADGSYYLDLCGTVTSTVCDMSGGGWTQVFSDNFDSGAKSGWSSTSTTSCGSWGTILGGYGTFGGGSVSVTVDTSCVSHTEAAADFDYIKLDSWDGESAYASFDGTQVWSQTMYYYTGSEVCGWNRGWSGSYDDKVAVSVSASHSASSLVFALGSTLNQDTSDESWGADNVVLWVR